MTCDCADPLVFGCHCWEPTRDQVAARLLAGEYITTTTEATRRYTEALQTLTRILGTHNPRTGRTP